MSKVVHRKKRLSSFKLIVLGFAAVIFVGALLLMLPVSSVSGTQTPFHEALFTSVSAVCVTGLVVQDTGSYWSSFGQTVILLLIQTGGLGVITVAVSFAILSGRKISLMQRSTMQDAISAPKIGGIVRLTKFSVQGTLFIELLGMTASFRFSSVIMASKASGWQPFTLYLHFAMPVLTFWELPASLLYL